MMSTSSLRDVAPRVITAVEALEAAVRHRREAELRVVEPGALRARGVERSGAENPGRTAVDHGPVGGDRAVVRATRRREVAAHRAGRSEAGAAAASVLGGGVLSQLLSLGHNR